MIQIEFIKKKHPQFWFKRLELCKWFPYLGNTVCKFRSAARVIYSKLFTLSELYMDWVFFGTLAKSFMEKALNVAGWILTRCLGIRL